MIRSVVALLFLATVAVVAGPAPRADGDAASAADGGVVIGRAYAEHRKPSGAPIPVAGVTLTLLPYSSEFVAAAEQVKQGARASLKTYRMAATEIERLRAAYEGDLRRSGAGRLLRSARTDEAGAFEVSGVAAGEWLLFARQDGPRREVARRPGRGERQAFRFGDVHSGTKTASFWLIPVTVESGIRASVDLTDRNVWFVGTLEEFEPPTPTREGLGTAR